MEDRGVTRKERLLRIAELEDRAVALICEMRRQWWRPRRNRQRRAQVRALFAECDAEFDAIAEAKAKYGRPQGGPRQLPPGAIFVSR